MTALPSLLMRAAVAAVAVAIAGCGAAGPGSVAVGTPVPVRVLVTTPPVQSQPPCTAAAALAGWSDDRLAWQVVIVPADFGGLASVAPAVASSAGGVLLFGAGAPPDLARQLAGLVATAPDGVPPLVMSDVEGGNVVRAANLLGPLPSARELGRTMSAPQIGDYARDVGRRMRAIGLTMDLAPVLDLDAGFGPTATNPDGTRSFSADPATAAADGAAFSGGLAAGGVVPVAKHFPGLHGEGDNTDVGPASTDSWAALERGGLVPFRAAIAAGAPAVMLSNASVPGLTDLPASLSPRAVAALRGELGFGGLILTDSLSSGAIVARGLSVPQAATAAVVAGADMVMYTDTPARVDATARATVAALQAAVASGSLPRAQLIASVRRVLTIKRVDPCAPISRAWSHDVS